MERTKLNGSVDVLAQAMRQVVTGAVEGAVLPIHLRMKAISNAMQEMEEDLGDRIEDAFEGLDTTNKNL